MMKKIITAALMLILLALPAYAGLFGGGAADKFSSKGVIPNGEPIGYRGLKITDDGVNIIIVNKGDKTMKFSAALTFIGDRNKEVGSTFIDTVTIAPQGQEELSRLYLGGDVKLCRKARSLSWTIYKLEEAL